MCQFPIFSYNELYQMKTILLTGFEPFGGEQINPSWEAVKRFNAIKVDGYTIFIAQLSCTFLQAGNELEQLIEQYQPSIVLNIGQAAGRNTISIEKVAINWIDARIPDNNGNQPVDATIISGAPDGYFSNLPLKGIMGRLNASGIPCSISYTAGTFVCNYVFYRLMHKINSENLAITGGFIHIPLLPNQAVNNLTQPSMSLETVVQGINLILQEIIQPSEYVPTSSGTIC